MTTEAIYNIKTHEESFTEPEIFLRREIESNLIEDLRNYTTQEALDSLKEYRATSDTFHPENHFYAFEGDELIGFIHLWPQYSGENNENVGEVANISLPFVKEGYDAAEQQLFDTVVNKAKELGITTLQVTIDSRHSQEIQRSDSYGFAYHELNRLNARENLSNIAIETTGTYNVAPFNREEHAEKVLDLYEGIGISRGQIENQFDWLEDMGERLVSWKVATDNDKVVGQSVAFVYENNQERAQMNVVTRPKDFEEEDYEKLVLDIYASHWNALEERGVEEIELNILSSALDIRHIYEKLGFDFVQTNAYRMDIT